MLFCRRRRKEEAQNTKVDKNEHLTMGVKENKNNSEGVFCLK